MAVSAGATSLYLTGDIQFLAGGLSVDALIGAFVKSIDTSGSAVVQMADGTEATVQVTSAQTTVQTLTSAATITWDLTSGYSALLTLGHNTTLTMMGGSSGEVAFLTVTQDTAGSRTLTLANTISRLGGVEALTLKTATNAVDLLLFVNIGGTWTYAGVK